MLIITCQRPKGRKSVSLRRRELRKIKKGKSKDSENYKKKLKTDKPKLTPWEQKEHSKRARELQEKRKERNLNTNKMCSETLKKPDKTSSWKEKEDLQNKPSRKEMNSWELLRSKKKLKMRKDSLNNKRSMSLRTTLKALSKSTYISD